MNCMLFLYPYKELTVTDLQIQKCFCSVCKSVIHICRYRDEFADTKMILFCLQISYTDLQIQRRFYRYKDDFVLCLQISFAITVTDYFTDTKTILFRNITISSTITVTDLLIQRRFCF
jgi:hypothetical protein